MDVGGRNVANMTDLLAARPGSGPRDASATPVDSSSLVLVAHRGPVRFSKSKDDGRWISHRNAGGLVTALEGIVQEVEQSVRWICAPASDEDRVVARAQPWTRFSFDANGSGSTGTSASCRVQMLDIERAAHDDFYNVIANPLLWFVQHELYEQAPSEIGARERRAWHEGYVEVNHCFAAALRDPATVPVGSTVMVHDYHFYLVPGMLRPTRPDLFIQHFTHIPWPRPEAWRLLPAPMRNAIFRGLLGSDIVGFHTAGHVHNFLRGCEELLGLSVDYDEGSVEFDGRLVVARHYPISINTDALENFAATPEVAERAAELRANRSPRIVLRVDRADPSKNIVRGFEAFAEMLRRHPELRGSVTFLALLQSTRRDVSEYVAYMRAIHDIVDAVNAEFSTAGWRPIELRLVDDLALAVAAYKSFDVLLVNSVADGMNLVVKEALVVNETAGAVVLSKRAGACDELGSVVITVDPFDVPEQAEAIYEALSMPEAVRRERLAIAADIVRSNNMQKWLRHQLTDIGIAREPLAT
jgi:trehalose 6-phosphate synthase